MRPATIKLPAVLALLAASVSPGAGAADPPSRFKLALESPGVYAVSFEDLASAGLEGTVASRRLGLSAGGAAVPVWVEDGGDGDFGPGDRIVFLGRQLAGETGYFHEFSRFNVYWLDLAADTPLQGGDTLSPPAPCGAGQSAPTGHLHVERNTLRVRFSSRPSERDDSWYWVRLAPNDDEAFEAELDLADLDPDAAKPVRFRIGFRGWSSHRGRSGADQRSDHRVVVNLGDRELARVEWNNAAGGYVAEGLEATAAETAAAGGTLAFRIPWRRGPGGALVDVALLDWIEVEYPRRRALTAAQAPLWRPAGGGSPCLVPTASAAAVYLPDGSRVSLDAAGAALPPDGLPALGEAPAYLLQGRPSSVSWIAADAPSALRGETRQVDYLMIAHPKLLEAIQSLAEFHRGRGLAVEVVSVDDVYDEFNHGVVHPRAVRDFLADAWTHRAVPRPRFVLLVGDASWDLSDEPVDESNYANMTFELFSAHGALPRRLPQFRFSPLGSEVYDEERPTGTWRNLIPTWDHRSADGPAASDNWLVDLEGQDLRPEMAIGRFPVVTPEEVEQIVAKTIAAAGSAARTRRAVLVTDHYQQSRSHADALAESLAAAAFETVKIYPDEEAAAGEDPSRPLLEAFDAGPELVYFVGHGGRFEWRTGPIDLANQSDLFTLEHLDRLADTPPVLPLVVSMACYSAPFDHPSADSIGEKLLRLPSKGAAAVVAAAWRIAPSTRTGLELLEELARGGTLGEVLLRTKRRVGDFQFISQFNLLGDPALPLAPWDGGEAAEGGGLRPVAE